MPALDTSLSRPRSMKAPLSRLFCILCCCLPLAGQAEGETPAEQGGGADYHFAIWEFQVEGNTLLDTKLVERTVYGFLGPDKTIKDIDHAREALENFYRGAGFPTVIVDIPEQDVSGGVVRLQVTEGTVSRVRVSGSRYFSLERIKSQVPALARGEVPSIPDVQSQLQELNKATPDRVVTPIFRPGRTPGTVEVELRVKDELPVHGDVELNNRYSKDTSELRLSGSLRYANLWQREHSAAISYMTSPQNTSDVKVLTGTYIAPLGDDILALYAVNTDSNVATAGNLTVLGKGTIAGARYIIPVHGSDSYIHNFTLGLDYKDFGESIVLQGADTLNTPISYTNLMTEYRATLIGSGSRLNASVAANFGPRGLGNNAGEFDNKRFNAKPNYFHLDGKLDYQRSLFETGKLVARFNAQLADSPLISNEQFSAGGADSVRGYFESQALGDDGIFGSLELYSPSLAGHIAEQVNNFQLLVFADAARLRIQDALPNNPDHYELYGAGAGFRLNAWDNLDVRLDWAWPLIDADQVQKGDSRGHFTINYGF